MIVFGNEVRQRDLDADSTTETPAGVTLLYRCQAVRSERRREVSEPVQIAAGLFSGLQLQAQDLDLIPYFRVH